MHMEKIIVANWKMNMSTVAEIEAFFEDFAPQTNPNVITVICPNYVNLNLVADLADEAAIYLGAQDVSQYEGGAYTGEVSAESLDDANVDYVIIGHSERRTKLNETDGIVNAKIKRALEHDIIPILCIDNEKQIKPCLDGVDASKVVIAYEPIGAIGTGKPATSADIEKAHTTIRKLAPKSKILYGGSVTDKNASEIMAIKNVDGVLVGGASLDPAKFAAIIEGASK